MLRYISTRLLYMVPVIWLVVSVVFLLIHLVPGDPIQQMLGENAAAGSRPTQRSATENIRSYQTFTNVMWVRSSFRAK
jgi:ABC-type dipeptide/oligopeptide/nickel transport system permease component